MVCYKFTHKFRQNLTQRVLLTETTVWVCLLTVLTRREFNWTTLVAVRLRRICPIINTISFFTQRKIKEILTCTLFNGARFYSWTLPTLTLQLDVHVACNSYRSSQCVFRPVSCYREIWRNFSWLHSLSLRDCWNSPILSQYLWLSSHKNRRLIHCCSHRFMNQ